MDFIWAIILAALTSYLVVAVLLFVCPLCWNQGVKLQGNVQIGAHRGGAGERIENTMAAFDNAVEKGCTLLEIDVQETKDGIVVISHDNDLSRVTGQEHQYKISDTLHQDLPTYSNGLHLDFMDEHCNSPQEDLSFVTLEDLFIRHPDVIIHIDTKEGALTLITKVSELIEQYDRHSKTIWGNMSEDANSRSYSINSKIPTFMSVRKVAIIYLTFYLGMIGFVPIKECMFDIPVLKSVNEQRPGILSPNQSRLMAFLDFFMMNRLLFWHLKRRGIKVVVFVLNTKNGFKRADYYNVDGIMTDYPTRLAKHYEDTATSETSQILKQ